MKACRSGPAGHGDGPAGTTDIGACTDMFGRTVAHLRPPWAGVWARAGRAAQRSESSASAGKGLQGEGLLRPLKREAVARGATKIGRAPPSDVECSFFVRAAGALWGCKRRFLRRALTAR